MGSLSSKPLDEVSTEELAAAVASKGPKFEPYGEAIRENAVDGALLDSFDEHELNETLEDLEITNRLHKRVLVKEWMEAKQRKELAVEDSGDSIPRVADDHKQEAREMAKVYPELDVTGKYPEPSEEVHRALVEAAAEYDLTPITSVEELETFDDITKRAMKECGALYTGIHLADGDGHTCVSSRFYINGQIEGCEPETRRLHAPRNLSFCYYFMTTSSSDFVSKPVPPGGSPFQVDTKESRYVGHILKSETGQRIGILCMYKEDDGDDKQEILSELARETENQLRMRKVLLARAKTLRKQVTNLQSQLHDEIVLPAYGPLKAVTLSQVQQRQSNYPDQSEIAAIGEPIRCSELPLFQHNHASPEEMTHLSSTYWDAANEMGIDRTPVSNEDMQRIAVTEGLGILDLEPGSPTARRLQNLAELAKRLFDAPDILLTFHLHEKSITIVGCGEACGVTVLKTDSDGCPFLCEEPRSVSCCNYPIHTKKTFVIHDMYEDQSFTFMKQHGWWQFYSGVPLIYHGYAIASLCVLDFKSRPDFTKAHEIQQEQIAQLMLREIINWSIRREVSQLEDSRKLLSSSNGKSSPPEHQAALVFTDVQGSTRLWESNSDSMHEALQLHDNIIRRCCAEYHGYEVITEGDAFHLAFHDAVDAVGFAIKVQKELYAAPWSDEILTLPDACDDGRGFRGLRVRIAIHCGKVAFRDNGVTGRREYTGKNVHIAKSLEHMAHGGQILVSSEVWSVASYVAESSLGSPQVVELGMHVLWTGKAENEGVISKGVVQIVPASLAFDYFGRRRSTDSEHEWGEKVEGERSVKGRQFPPPVSRRRLSLSFHDAPYEKNEVTMVFVRTSEIEELYDDPSMILACLTELIGSLLGNGPGYQCKNFMVAFHNPSEAAAFGLMLQERLREEPVNRENLSGLIKVGFHHGEFTSMGPHQTSGRAEYFGKVVNRAARVASAAEPGQVLLGCLEDENPELGPDLDTRFVGKRVLKGVQEEMFLHCCVRATIPDEKAVNRCS